MKLPEKFVENLKQLLTEEEWLLYLQSFETKRVFGLRLNGLKPMNLELLGIQLKSIPWTTNGYYYKQEDQVTKSPLYYAGAYYVQEPSAMSPAALLPIHKNDKVLDLCAAPGGKSTELGGRLDQTGVLVANDISYSRAQVLLKNIENFGIRNSFITNEESGHLATLFPSYFDKILIDAPCSGEGMFRKDPSMIKEWDHTKPEYYAEIQKKLLKDSFLMLKSGGYMMYSTCTFSPIENECLINDFLDKHPQCRLVDITSNFGFKNGFDHLCDESHRIERSKRLWPFYLEGEGHFMALIYKEVSDDITLNDYVFQSNYVHNEAFELFLEDTINYSIERKQLWMHQDKIYLLPNQSPDTKGLRVLRSGLLLGEIKKNRFEPSHALALGFKKEDFKKTMDFKKDDIAVMNYLKGFSLDTDLEGWIVVCVEGLPLGFGKGNQGVLKNKYHVDWRMK